jgi:tetratricopeptide (TPR) repeat protein
MSAKVDERYLRVYCPTHKVSFSVMEASGIVCEGGGEALAQNYPYESFWEYCCDCQSLWVSNLSKGEKSSGQCPVCSREIKRRYICDQCKVISLESDEAVKRKTFTIARGVVEPSCPGCSKISAGITVREHECDEAGIEFTTAHALCPFCDEQIADRPSFPILAAEYLDKIRARKIPCKAEPQRNLLVEDAEGGFVLIAGGNGANHSIVLPRSTVFSSKQDYYNYKDYYDCEDPAAGEVFIIYPATVDKIEQGWKLAEVGRLRVKTEAIQEQSRGWDEAATSDDSQAVCPGCGTAAKPEYVFCKECGYALKPQESSLDWPEQTLPPTGGHELTAPGSAPQQSKIFLHFILPLGACAALILFIIAVANRSGGSSAESKLERAIANRNLIAPPGESAYDYYQQLKREGASRSTISRFEDKLLPLLASNSQEMIASVAKPDGKDATLAEWEEASKLLSWATEINPNDNALGARADYCKGRIAYLNKRMDEALNLWKSASDKNRSWGLPLSDSGYIYLKDKTYKNPLMALGLFREAISREKDWAIPYLYAGDSYYVQKFYGDAQPFYEDAARLAPQWARPHAALGNLAKLRGDQYWSQSNYGPARQEYQTAQRELEQALELSSKSSSNFNRKGVDDDLHDIRQRLEQLSGGEDEE